MSDTSPPVEKRGTGRLFLRAALWSGFAFGAWFLGLVAVPGLADISAATDFTDVITWEASPLLAFVLGMLAVCWAARRWRRGGVVEVLGVVAVKWKVVVGLCIVTVVAVLLHDVLRYALGLPLLPPEYTRLIQASNHPIVLSLGFLIAAPIFEEVYFRGFFITAFGGTCLRPWGAAVVAAAIWAFAHTQYDLTYMPIIFLAGLAFAGVRLLTGSIVPAVVAHALINLMSYVHVMFFLER
ncbi:MAG: CPBP family intramembrane metalloprotease [Candidatus Lernaella stagnicola]|nr:CPBP family intramembrane metalloprotease [Candidatus Lernaella stagnicola]